MLRHVVVCLPVHRPSAACLETGLAFARGYGSWLTGLVVRETAPVPYPLVVDPMVPAFPTPEMLDAYRGEFERHEAREDELEDELERRFRHECRARGIPHDVVVRTGDPRFEALAVTQAADLVCMERGAHDASMLQSVSGWLVRHVPRPVLLAGDDARDFAKVGVAFDGSPGAWRALSLVADMAHHWTRGKLAVHLIGAGKPGATLPDLTPAARYLDMYGVESYEHDRTGDAADVIVETGERFELDLVAMGAYGHSILREVVLGSTTQDVMGRWRRPLLLWR